MSSVYSFPLVWMEYIYVWNVLVGRKRERERRAKITFVCFLLRISSQLFRQTQTSLSSRVSHSLVTCTYFEHNPASSTNYAYIVIMNTKKQTMMQYFEQSSLEFTSRTTTLTVFFAHLFSENSRANLARRFTENFDNSYDKICEQTFRWQEGR